MQITLSLSSVEGIERVFRVVRRKYLEDSYEGLASELSVLGIVIYLSVVLNLVRTELAPPYGEKRSYDWHVFVGRCLLSPVLRWGSSFI